MGGKVWSDSEEEVFWTSVARLAPPGLHKESKVVKKGRGEIAKSWAPLVTVMKKQMAKKNPGKDLPRKYTPISIYEHHFQNLIQGKLSPNAGRHVEAHRAWLKTMAENPESVFKVEWSGSITSVESDSSEFTASNASLEPESRTNLENSISSNAIPLAATPQQSQQVQQPSQISQSQHLQQPQQMPPFQNFQQMLPSQNFQQMPPFQNFPQTESHIRQEIKELKEKYRFNTQQRSCEGPSPVAYGVPAPFTAHTNGQQYQYATERIPFTYDPICHPFVNGVQFFHSFPPHCKNQD